MVLCMCFFVVGGRFSGSSVRSGLQVGCVRLMCLFPLPHWRHMDCLQTSCSSAQPPWRLNCSLGVCASTLATCELLPLHTSTQKAP